MPDASEKDKSKRTVDLVESVVLKSTERKDFCNKNVPLMNLVMFLEKKGEGLCKREEQK